MASNQEPIAHGWERAAKLKNYIPPRKNFKVTKALEGVLELMKSSKILHVFGMSGSGKSQTLAAVCQKLDEDSERIIWHMQCQERSETLQEKWKKMLDSLTKETIVSLEVKKNMLEAFLHRNQQGYQKTEMMKFMKEPLMKFIKELNSRLRTPLLLVIEDVALSDEKIFVKVLAECIGDKRFSQDNIKIQLLMATQDKHAIYQQLDLDEFDVYRTYHLRGFTDEEAYDFLRTNGMPITDETKVKTLAQELAYSPLGLFVMKSYCLKLKLSYEKYYDSLEKSVDVKTEKKLMKEDEDLRGKNHRYNIIRNLLTPEQHCDEDERIQSEVFLMLSFVNHWHIPIQLLKRFFFVLGQTNATVQDRSALRLVERLEKEVNSSLWDRGKGEKLLSIHSDVLRALRLSMSDEKKTNVLAKVVAALASILDKDNRETERYMLLHGLKIHAEALVGHTDVYFEKLNNVVRVQSKDCEILLGLSKIHEVIGYAISQHQGMRIGYEEDKNYERALAYIWKVVRSNAGSFPSFAIDFEEGKDVKETAEEAYEILQEASLHCDEVLRNDSEKSYPVKKNHFIEMERRLGEGSGIDWIKLSQEIDDNGSLTDTSKKFLCGKKMLLEWSKLKGFYLAEKITSILHSRGRISNYKGDIIPAEMHKKCAWYVDLGLELCDIAFQKTGVKSLFLHIMRVNNMLPCLVFKKSQNETDEEFIERMNKCHEMALVAKQEKSDFYEQGIYKIVSDTAWTLMLAGKYAVRANTVLHKRPNLVTRYLSPTADKEFRDLYEISKSNPDVSISSGCLIYAGKYSAARKRYAEALEIFWQALRQGTEGKIQINSTEYGWALANVGRTILAAGHTLKKRQDHIAHFRRRYDIAKSDVPEKWRKILDDMLQKMQ